MPQVLEQSLFLLYEKKPATSSRLTQKFCVKKEGLLFFRLLFSLFLSLSSCFVRPVRSLVKLLNGEVCCFPKCAYINFPSIFLSFARRIFSFLQRANWEFTDSVSDSRACSAHFFALYGHTRFSRISTLVTRKKIFSARIVQKPQIFPCPPPFWKCKSARFAKKGKKKKIELK